MIRLYKWFVGLLCTGFWFIFGYTTTDGESVAILDTPPFLIAYLLLGIGTFWYTHTTIMRAQEHPADPKLTILLIGASYLEWCMAISVLSISATGWFTRRSRALKAWVLVETFTAIHRLIYTFATSYSRYGIRDTSGSIPIIRHDNFAGLYFSVITITTVGYGDFSCVSDACRYAAALEAVFGYSLLALTITVAGIILRELWR